MSTTDQKTFDVSRKEAADILNVSTRTLDRYINKRVLSSKNVAGRIFLNKDELFEYVKKRRKHKSVRRKKRSTIKHAKKIYEIPVEHITGETGGSVEGQEIEDDGIDIISNVEEKVYKKLYEELRTEVKMFQQRLEGANYRVGQLQSQVENSVPLLDHQKLLQGHKEEKYNKKVLYILLSIVLLAQPIWLILVFL